MKLNLKEDREEEFMHPVSRRTTDDLSQFIGCQINFHENEKLGFGDEHDRGFDESLLDFSPSVCLN